VRELPGAPVKVRLESESGDASLIAALKALPLKAHRGKTFSLHRYCRNSNLFGQAVK
jgi:hypothetical protein